MSHYDALALPASGTDTFQDLCDAAEEARAPDDVRATAQIACMWLSQRADRLQDAQARAERFLASPLAEDPQNRMKALNTLAVVHKLRGELHRAADLTLEGLKIAQNLGDKVRQAICMTNLIEFWVKLGNFAELEKHLIEFEAVIKDIGWISMICSLQWAKLELPGVEYNAYIKECNQIMNECKKANDTQSEASITLFISQSYLRTGRYIDSIYYANRAVSLLKATDTHTTLLFAKLIEVRAKYALGKFQEARRCAIAGLELAIEIDTPVCLIESILAVSKDLLGLYPDAKVFLHSIAIDGRAEYIQRREAEELAVPCENTDIIEPIHMAHMALKVLFQRIG